jgi:hypothetical protein
MLAIRKPCNESVDLEFASHIEAKSSFVAHGGSMAG